MTSEGLGEMFEGDTADMCAGKFPLVSMGGRVEGLARADSVARTLLALAEILLTLATVVQNPRRGCRMVPKFCMGS